MTSELSAAEARRIALAAQGFDRSRPARVGLRHLQDVIERLALVQLDFVTVLLPAHYQVLFSRLGPYPRRLLDDLVYRRRRFTEQWAHEASIVPVDTWPLLQHRRERHRVRPRGFERVMERLGGSDRAHGRLRVLGAYVESFARPAAVVPPLAAELRTLARWLDLPALAVERRGNLARALSAALR